MSEDQGSRRLIPLTGQHPPKSPDGQHVRIELSAPSADAKTSRADIVLVIDTTGSMNDKIDGLLQTCRKFAERLRRKAVDWQIATVAFGDLTVRGDRIEATAFSKSLDAVKESLSNIPRNSGGANEGESSLEALEKAMTLRGYRAGAMKVFILITDEPALQHQVSAGSVTQGLRRHRVITYVVSPPLDYFKRMAKDTGGRWFEVAADTNFLSIMDVFDRLTQEVARTVERVQLDAGGNVERYLQLPGCRS